MYLNARNSISKCLAEIASVRLKMRKISRQNKCLHCFFEHPREGKPIVTMSLDLVLVGQIMYLHEGEVNPGDEEKVIRY